MSCLQEMVAPLPPGGVQEICACYFETHVSPMLKSMQRSQELINLKLEDSYTSVQKALDALTVEQRLLKIEFDEFISKSSDEQKLSTQSNAGLASRRSMNGPRVSAPCQMHHQGDVDASEESLHSKQQECMALLEQPNTALAKKADSAHVETWLQLQEMRMELLAGIAGTAEHKVEGSSACKSAEGNKVQGQVEPTGQDVSKVCSILKAKLTNAEEDNEGLQVRVNAAMKELKSVCAAKAVDFEAAVTTFSDVAILQVVTSQSAMEPGGMESRLTQLQNAMKSGLAAEMAEQTKTEVPPSMHGGFEVMAARDDLPFLNGDSTPMQEPLEKDLEESLLDKEFTFLSDDSTEDPCATTFLSEDFAREPCSAKRCTHELEPTRQEVPNRRLSEILKLKLTNVEEENERLQQEHDDMSKKLQELTSMPDMTWV